MIWCGGRQMSGPYCKHPQDAMSNNCVWILLLGLTGVFYYQMGSVWYHDYFPFFVMYNIVFPITVLSLLFTQCSDPGIIPRRAILDLYEDRERVECFYHPFNRSGGRLVKFNYCHLCQIWRPRRASHCK